MTLLLSYVLYTYFLLQSTTTIEIGVAESRSNRRPSKAKEHSEDREVEEGEERGGSDFASSRQESSVAVVHCRRSKGVARDIDDGLSIKLTHI